MNQPYLHIYSPAAWHDDAFIVGNRLGLLKLANALLAALTNDHSGTSSDDFFTNDGEGYSARVASVGPDEMDTLDTPYTDRELTGEHRGCQPGEFWYNKQKK